MKIEKSNKKPLFLLLVIVIIIGGVLIFIDNRGKNTPTQTLSNQEVTTIKLDEKGFSPQKIQVKLNTRIIWINNSQNTATVNSDNHPTHTLYPFLNLGEFGKGMSIQTVMTKKGTFTYHNHYNPSEKGTIVVQ